MKDGLPTEPSSSPFPSNQAPDRRGQRQGDQYQHRHDRQDRRHRRHHRHGRSQERQAGIPPVIVTRSSPTATTQGATTTRTVPLTVDRQDNDGFGMMDERKNTPIDSAEQRRLRRNLKQFCISQMDSDNDDEQDNEDQNVEQDRKNSPSNVAIRIVRGDSVNNDSRTSSTDIVPPPDSDPPVPSSILRLVVLGSRRAGTSSVVQRFLHRTFVHRNDDDDRNPDERETIFPTTEQQQTQEPWTLQYHKKDISFHHEWSPDGIQDETLPIQCVRVQIWDVSGLDNRQHLPVSDESMPNTDQQQLHRLLSGAATIFLVVSIENGVKRLMDETKAWVEWFRKRHEQRQNHQHPSATKDGMTPNRIPIMLLVTKCDLLPQHGVPPTEWILLGSQLERMCHYLGVQEFRLVACVDENHVEQSLSSMDMSVEGAFMDVVRSFRGDGRTDKGNTKT